MYRCTLVLQMYVEILVFLKLKGVQFRRAHLSIAKRKIILKATDMKYSINFIRKHLHVTTDDKCYIIYEDFMKAVI